MPKTLLLADDSITIQKVVGITFAAEDYQITAVDNGEDAIAKARQMKPDIILADVVMPRKNGYEVCEAIKADPQLQRIPVLLLAGTFEAFDENRARAARADGHIAKPFESGALIAKVKELAEGLKPAAQPAAPARPAAPQPAPAPAPYGSPAAAARPAAVPAPGARPGMPGAMPFGAPPGSRPTMPGAAPPGGFRPGMPGAMPPAGFRPAVPGAAPPGFRPAMPSGAHPAGPMPGPGMHPTGPGMAARPGIPFAGAPPAGARPTMPGARPPAAGPWPPGARAPMQPAPVARPAVPAAPPGRAPAPATQAAPEHRARESFGFDFGPGPGAQPPADLGDLGGLGEKAPVPSGKAAVRGGVPKGMGLEGAPGEVPAPIDLGLEEPGEVELAPVHPFVPPAAATGRPVGAPAGDAGEAALREALSKASLEVIERVVWEVVPQLAEVIIRENLDRLAKERQGA